jgi:hypothetical protein
MTVETMQSYIRPETHVLRRERTSREVYTVWKSCVQKRQNETRFAAREKSRVLQLLQNFGQKVAVCATIGFC